MTAIRVENLCVYHAETCLLGPVSFGIAGGSTLVVMGETGAGKSLIVQAIMGTLPQGLSAQGAVYLNDQRIDTLKQSKRSALWGRQITTLPQEPWRALDPLMKSWRQVAETHTHVAGLPADQSREQTAKSLFSLGLGRREPRLPGELSGGMAQRVAFAAASAGQAPIFLADEPTKGLDTERKSRIIELLAQVPSSGGVLLVITHECSVARALGGELLVLRNGNVIEQGPSVRVLDNPQQPYTQELCAATPEAWPHRAPTPPSQKALLTAERIAVKRGQSILFRNFDFTIHERERVAIYGPSGVGKTSLIDTLAGLIPQISGRIVRDPSLTRFAVQKLYQDPPAAFPPRVLLGGTLADVARIHHCPWSAVLDYMDQLQLSTGLLGRYPDQVSGGELQRIAMIRVLIANPRVILADEPTSRLDPITQKHTLDLLGAIGAKRSIALVILTHSPDIAQKWADRAIALQNTEN